MKTTKLCIVPAIILLALSLQACKKPAAQPAATSAAPVPAVQPVPAADTAPQSEDSVIAALEQEAAAATSFDFNSVPEAKNAVPPFPYVAFPPTVGKAFQWDTTLPMDELIVILGDKPHRLEGRLAERRFSHRDAQMSEVEVRRNYENALQAFGAVKVNTRVPDYPASYRRDRLRQPDSRLSYDVYLVRKGNARHWIVVMTDSDTTRLLSLEEQPFAQTIGYEGAAANGAAVTATGAPTVAPQPLDIHTVPVHTAPLPPFPYLAYPPQLNRAHYVSGNANFDAISFIVGRQLRTVEGRVETRGFSNKTADMSPMAIRRNYEAALAGLGAVKVNTVGSRDPGLIAANGSQYDLHKKLRIPDANLAYDSYLLRTPDKNIWMALMFSDDRTAFVVVEEKAMQQSVALVSAATMRTELAAKGHIPLYINFDTDQATIRTDGKPAVDEIAALLRNDASLKLSIEGHTDNSGDTKHNLDLSRQRADAVVQQLVASGIDAARLKAAGRGAATPLADNNDDAGRSKNRRVELVKI